MAVLRLFAAAREAAGLVSDEIEAPTVGEMLQEATRRYGDRFGAVLATSRVWVNGEPAVPSRPVQAGDVVAVLPPVSGGSAHLVAGPRPPAAAPPPGPPPPGPTGAAPPFPPALSPPVAARPAPPPLVRLVPAPPPGAPPPAVPSPPAPDSAGPAVVAAPPPAPPAPSGPGPGAEVHGNLAVAPDAGAGTAEEPGAPSRVRPPLAVVHQSNRPHGRLGLAWAGATVGATVGGVGWLAAWMAVAAFVAASQTASVWRKRGERPLTLLAAAVAAGLPVAAAFGTGSIAGVVTAGILAAFVTRMAVTTKAPSRDVGLTVAIGIAIGLAAASPVLLRHLGRPAPLLLLAFACVYDAGAYLVGTGASSPWEGPAAGVAALIPLTLLAAVFAVPLPGAAPLLLGLLAAALAPAGPVAGSALLGEGTADAPGLRRLDSLLLMGPVWAWCAAAFLK